MRGFLFPHEISLLDYTPRRQRFATNLKIGMLTPGRSLCAYFCYHFLIIRLHYEACRHLLPHEIGLSNARLHRQVPDTIIHYEISLIVNTYITNARTLAFFLLISE